jgi:transposase
VETTANPSKDIGKLIAKLAKEHENIHLVCEATGGYEKHLLKAAFKAGCPISLMNARCVRSFADAMSQHAKTDPIDAQIRLSVRLAGPESANPEEIRISQSPLRY